MRVLVTGATGLIGRALVRALLARDDTVHILTRKRAKPQQPVITHTWDAQAMPATLSPEQVDVVVHLAGASVAEKRWTPAYKALLWRSRVETTKVLVQWMRNHPIRLISASAVGYYGGDLSLEQRTEASPPGKDFLAGLALAWEAAALEARHSPPFIARFGTVLSLEGGALPKLLNGFRLGVGSYPGPGHQGFSWVHIEDAVQVLLWALDRPQANGPYNVCAPQPVSSQAFAQAVAKHKKTRLLLPLPPSLLHLVLGEMATLLTQGAYVYPERLLAEGYTFGYPDLESALKSLLGPK